MSSGKICAFKFNRGFTLIELVMVVIITGILAIVALPRFLDRHDFDSAGFKEQTLAALRYAQKSAIAQRHLVCATFSTTATSSSVALTIASTNPPPAAPCDLSLTGPTGAGSYTVASRGGVVFAGVPVTLYFNALGQPVDNSGNVLSSASTITISGQAVITVEPETGYVH